MWVFCTYSYWYLLSFLNLSIYTAYNSWKIWNTVSQKCYFCPILCPLILENILYIFYYFTFSLRLLRQYFTVFLLSTPKFTGLICCLLTIYFVTIECAIKHMYWFFYSGYVFCISFLNIWSDFCHFFSLLRFTHLISHNVHIFFFKSVKSFIIFLLMDVLLVLICTHFLITFID